MKSPYDTVARTVTSQSNPMALTEAQPNYTRQYINALYGNVEQAENNIQNLYKTTISDPCVTGVASHRKNSIDNYFGYLYIPYKDSRTTYNNIGLPTGGGVDPFYKLKMPVKFSLSGR